MQKGKKMVETFLTNTVIVMKSESSKRMTAFNKIFKNIEHSLSTIDTKIETSDKELKLYSSFIRDKIFSGVQENNKFASPRKSQIKMFIDSVSIQKYDQLYNSALEISLNETKNLDFLYDNQNISETLDSISSVDDVLLRRLKRIKSLENQKSLSVRMDFHTNKLSTVTPAYTTKNNLGNMSRSFEKNTSFEGYKHAKNQRY